MQMIVTFKTPDAVDWAITDYIESLEPPRPTDPDYDGYTEDPEGWFLTKTDEIREFLGQWIEYGETVTLEFDTVDKTAVVKRT
jgi:hypothetical protein